MRDAWWADESNGRVVVLGYPSQADLVQLSAPRQGQPPDLLAVQVTSTDDLPPVGPDPLDARILVDLSWGNARAPLEATIDCGQTVVLCATTLRASVRTPGEAVSGSSRVRIMVSLARSAAAHRATFTDTRIAIAPAGVAAWSVPPWARSVVLATNYDPRGPANTMIIEWMPPIGAGGVFARQLSGGASLTSSRVDVPRGARILQMTNGAVATSATPIWELAI
jgi:hypothetical protein